LIAFEGGEASGKSTQAALLAGRLGALLTREPGGTAIGERVRSVLLDRASGAMSPRAETLLLAADRAQHVDEVLRPVLESGRDVVTDRYSDSTLAYQGFGRGLDPGELTTLSSWASAGLEPDVVILLDVPAGVAALRVEGREPDRLEAQGDDFHERVARGYRTLAASDLTRWLVVDGSGTVEEVAARVRAAFEAWEAAQR
jgi:dTMP kinase